MKVLFYPVGVSNPYHRLLIEHLKKMPIASVTSFNNKYIDKHGYILGIISFPLRLTYYRLLGYNVFHLHWIDPFIIYYKNSCFNKLSTLYIVGFIAMLKILNYKIVWTIHNMKTLEGIYIYDELVNKLLAKIVNAKIIHSKQNIKDMKIMNYDIKNTYTIPIGNYIGVYKNLLTKEKARKILNINRDRYVILCFGRVEPYKGIDDLIEQFTDLNLTNATLLIVGPCLDNLYKNKLLKYNKNNIVLNLKFVSDEKIQIYFKAADIIACPYKFITTSSSVILALSFGKPIIAPLIGNIVDLPKDLGFFYDIQNKTGLKTSILSSISHKNLLSKMGNNSYRFSKKLSWDKIANQTYEVYRNIINN